MTVLDAWADYFEDLATPSEQQSFDIVMLDSLSCLFTSISVLITCCSFSLTCFLEWCWIVSHVYKLFIDCCKSKILDHSLISFTRDYSSCCIYKYFKISLMKICSLVMYMVPNLFNSSDSARHRSQDICLIVVIQLDTGLRTFV